MHGATHTTSASDKSESSLTPPSSLGDLGRPSRHLTWIRFFSTLSWTKSIPILFSRWYRHSRATCREQQEIVCFPCSRTKTLSGGSHIYLGHDPFFPRETWRPHVASSLCIWVAFGLPHSLVRGAVGVHDCRWVQYCCRSHRSAVQVKSAWQL